MPRAIHLAALIGSLTGCGPAPVTEAPDRPTLVIEPTETTLPQTSKRSHAEDSRCEIAHDDFASLRTPWSLLSRPADKRAAAERSDRDVWARLMPRGDGRVSVALEGDVADDVEVAFTGAGLELHTRARTKDILFFPTKPIWFAGVVLAHARQVLEVERAQAGRVAVTLVVGSELVPARVTDRASCDALALEPGDFQIDELTKLEGPDSFTIVGGDPVPIFPASSGGRSGIALALPPGTPLVAGERVGARRRIRHRFPRRPFTVLGWVPDDRLKHSPGHGWGGTGGSGVGAFGRPGRRRLAHRRDYRCRTRVPLWILRNGHRERVGALLPERPFYVDANARPRGDHQPIFIDDVPVDLKNGARFAVPTRELAGCTVLP